MDDIRIHDINTGLFAYPAILAGHELGLFELLGRAPRTQSEVVAELGLATRSADVLLRLGVALGFVDQRGDHFEPSELTRAFLLRASPTSWAPYLDALIANAELFDFGRIRDCLRRDEPQLYEGRDAFAVNAADPERAARYTRWMNSVSQGPAMAWPHKIDLSGVRTFLDVAGGSAVHSITAARRFPGLTCVVADLPTVGAVAQEFIGAAGLSERINVASIDMWNDPLPRADVHFYSQIFHDWSPTECVRLARRSFDALPPGGRILVHELLMADDGCGPVPAVVVNLMMALMYTGGRQYSGRELEQFLVEAGFGEVQRIPTYGHWHLVVGTRA